MSILPGAEGGAYRISSVAGTRAGGCDRGRGRRIRRTKFDYRRLGLIFLMVSITVHMRIGVQVVIEDYIQANGLKTVLLMANTLFTVAIGGIAVFAILKLAFGGM